MALVGCRAVEHRSIRSPLVSSGLTVVATRRGGAGVLSVGDDWAEAHPRRHPPPGPRATPRPTRLDTFQPRDVYPDGSGAFGLHVPRALASTP
jgi:hypothetical protein